MPLDDDADGLLYVCERHFSHFNDAQSPLTVVPTMNLAPDTASRLDSKGSDCYCDENETVVCSGGMQGEHGGKATRQIASGLAPT